MLRGRTLFNVLGAAAILFWIAARSPSPELDDKLILGLALFWIGAGFSASNPESEKGRPFVWLSFGLFGMSLSVAFLIFFAALDAVAGRFGAGMLGTEALCALWGGVAFSAARYRIGPHPGKLPAKSA